MKEYHVTCRGCGASGISRTSKRFYCSPLCVLIANSTSSGDCWIWTGYVTPRREGAVTYRNETMRLAELVGMAANVTPTETHIAGQSCGTRLCCNPQHSALRPRKRPLWPNSKKG